LDLYTIHRRVGASSTDENGALKLGAALDLIQDCSYHWMESEPVFLRFLEENNAAMVLVSRQADFMRLPRYGERLMVSTFIFECHSFLGRRNTVICDETNRPCVLTWSVGAFINRETGKMTRLTPEVMNAVTMDPKADMEYLDMRIALPDAAWRRFDPVPVRRGDIDLNRHMNNARYVETALEYLPDDFAVRRLRVEYKAPAKRGALLYPRTAAASDGRYFILLTNEDGQPYTIMEFS